MRFRSRFVVESEGDPEPGCVVDTVTVTGAPRALRSAVGGAQGKGASRLRSETGLGGQPLANRFMLVGSVVVQDDVQGEVGRERTVETPQELQEFLMSIDARGIGR